MSSEFKSPRLRWARAQDHIIDLDRRIKAFFDSKPYTSVIDPDPDGIHELHKIRFIKPLPDDLMVVTAEAVEHLRSSLDQAGFAVARAASGNTAGKYAYFPFAESSLQVEKKFIGKGKSKDIPEKIRPLFCSFQPYNGGNNLLWALNRMCNTNKHTMLVPVAFVSGGISCAMTFRGTERDLPMFCNPPVWDRRNQEFIIFRSKASIKIDYNAHVSFDVAFDEVEVVSGQPAVALLNKFSSEVDRILTAIEAEARRLGYV